MVCPDGWHLPTDEEWKILEKNQGMSNSDADADGDRNSVTVGGKLKETGTAHWYTNSGATNESNFTALPCGCRGFYGDFLNLGQYTSFWSSSEAEASEAWSRNVSLDEAGVMRWSDYRSNGFSVRCLKD